MAFLALAACDGAPLVTSAAFAPRQITVTGDDVVIAAPRGYCIDPDTTREIDDTATVVMASCTGDNASAGVLTASVSRQNGAQISAALAGLATHFETPVGRAALSRTGDPDAVAVLDVFATDDTLFLHVEDQVDELNGLAKDYWRAMFDLGNRIATVSVRGLDAQPLDTASGLKAAQDLAQRIKARN